jgi:hypothetical protein
MPFPASILIEWPDGQLMRLLHPALLFALATLTACGGRSDLLAIATGDTGDDAGAAAPDAGPAAPACAWALVPGAPIALTDPAVDHMVSNYVIDGEGAEAVEGDRIYLAMQDGLEAGNQTPDPNWRVSVVSDDLSTIGPSQLVLPHGQNGAEPMAIASGFGHRGAIAMDSDAGCRFVAIADDGSPAAAPVLIESPVECFWLRATPSGFTMFTRPDWAPFSLLTLDASGHVVATRKNVGPPDGDLPHARAKLPDGSTLIAWPSFAAAMNLQRWSAEGDPLTEPTALFAMPPVTIAAMTVVGSTVLLAWAPYEGEVGAVYVQPLDGDGHALGAPTKIAPADGAQVLDFDIGAAGDDALVTWRKGEDFSSVLTVQPVTVTGAAKGGPIVVPATPHVGATWIGGTPTGAILGFDGLEPGGHAQVFVTRLRCEGG